LISRRVTAAEPEWLERRCGGLGRACENADAGDLGRLLRNDYHSNSKQCHRYQD